MEDGLRGLRHSGLILHRFQEPPLGVERLQRLGLLMIDIKTHFHGLGGIILPLDQLASLPVTGLEEKLVAQLPAMLFDEEQLLQSL